MVGRVESTRCGVSEKGRCGKETLLGACACGLELGWQGNYCENLEQDFSPAPQVPALPTGNGDVQ